MDEYIVNEPAFPRTQWTGSDKNAAHRDVKGMSIRDYFAAAALQGILAGKGRVEIDGKEYPAAKAAFMIADEMLKARSGGIGNYGGK